MCGICGILTLNGPVSASARAQVERMLDAMAHRGPDGRAIVATPSAVFGATRLMIRGTTAGRQPLIDEDRGTITVCNGEIDNHRDLAKFLTRRGRRWTRRRTSPSSRLSMPSWEMISSRSWKEPLRWRSSTLSGTAWFLRAIAPASVRSTTAPTPKERSSLQASSRRSGRTPRCRSSPTPAASLGLPDSGAFLLPNRRCRESERSASAKCWPSKPAADPRPDTGGGRRDGASSLLPLTSSTVVFREAVRRQTDVDVPFAVLLSGGLDSSLVAAVVRQIRPDVKLRAFSARFQDGSYDEGKEADRAASFLGVELTHVWVNPADVPAELSRLVRVSGEPLADPAWIPTSMLARKVSTEARVALVGEGADELFGGYPTYIGAWLGERYASLPRVVRRIVRTAVSWMGTSERCLPLISLLAKFTAAEGLDAHQRHLLWTSNTSPRDSPETIRQRSTR